MAIFHDMALANSVVLSRTDATELFRDVTDVVIFDVRKAAGSGTSGNTKKRRLTQGHMQRQLALLAGAHSGAAKNGPLQRKQAALSSIPGWSLRTAMPRKTTRCR